MSLHREFPMPNYYNAKKGKWKNIKTDKIREGLWYYYWPSDVFFVKINGIRSQRVHGENPEFGNWKKID